MCFLSFLISGSPWWAFPGHVSTLRWHGEQTGRDRSCQSYLFLLLPDVWSQGEPSVVLLRLHLYIDLTLFLHWFTTLVKLVSISSFQMTANFWQTWKEFEIRHGNEDTIREMLRIKRSVQATYNTQVNFMSSQMLKATTSSTGKRAVIYYRYLHFLLTL